MAHAFQAIGMNEHMINCVHLLSNTEKQKELLEVSIIISKCVYTLNCFLLLRNLLEMLLPKREIFYYKNVDY